MKKIFQSLYVQVLIAITIGVLLGHFYPETGAAMKPLGDGFIKLIKMIIAPIIFCTIVVGIAGTVLPALPGTLFVVAGVVLGAWIDSFSRVSVATVIVITVLGVISFAIEYIAGAMGARKVGASREAVIGALIGTVVSLAYFALPSTGLSVVLGCGAGIATAAAFWIIRRPDRAPPNPPTPRP